MKRRETAAGLLVPAVLFLLFVAPTLLWVAATMRSDHLRASADVAQTIFLAQFLNTVLISVASAFIATVLGAAVACDATFSSEKRRRTISVLMAVPLLLGFLARNYAWLGLLQTIQMGAQLGIQLPVDILYSRTGVIVVIGTVMLPFAYFITLQSLRAIKREHLEAALTMGADETRTFCVVVIPMAFRGILLGFTMTTVMAASYFITPKMIGGAKFDFVSNGVLTLRDVIADPLAAAQTAIGLALALLPLTAVVLWLSVRRRRQLVGE